VEEDVDERGGITMQEKKEKKKDKDQQPQAGSNILETFLACLVLEKLDSYGFIFITLGCRSQFAVAYRAATLG
jgi:hypothetical protein